MDGWMDEWILNPVTVSHLAKWIIDGFILKIIKTLKPKTVALKHKKKIYTSKLK